MEALPDGSIALGNASLALAGPAAYAPDDLTVTFSLGNTTVSAPAQLSAGRFMAVAELAADGHATGAQVAASFVSHGVRWNQSVLAAGREVFVLASPRATFATDVRSIALAFAVRIR